jgi:hypothetical protein
MSDNVVALAPVETKPKTPHWNGREVRFAEYSVAAGREIRDAFAKDRELGGWTILAKSMRYVDSGELVFATAAEIDELPNRLYGRLAMLAADAIETVGGFEATEYDKDRPT